MTFAYDQIKDEYQVEHHSLGSIAFVSALMILFALGLLTVVA